jgi:hypothetical protein
MCPLPASLALVLSVRKVVEYRSVVTTRYALLVFHLTAPEMSSRTGGTPFDTTSLLAA